MTVRYNVTDASNPTQLYVYESKGDVITNGTLMFDNAVIDGTEVSISDLDTAGGQIQFSVGEHTVKYTLKDPTLIGGFGDPSDPSSFKFGAVFFNCKTILSVEIPNTVTTIGINAFGECSALTSVIIPNSVTNIGDNAFTNCTSLMSVTIPNSVTNIGDYAFNNCGLTSVTIPNSVISIGNEAFASCSGLTSINIPNSVTVIKEGAFAMCINLTSVIIGSGVTNIESHVFRYCSSLTSIICNATIAPTIYNDTFRDIKTNGTLTVLAGSTGYDVWMNTGNYYLGRYEWTMVE